jgi:hypothetical protein
MAGTEWRLARDDLLPGGDGVLVPAEELPEARAGDVVLYVERDTGQERRGRIVGLIEQDGARVLAVEVLDVELEEEVNP